MALHLTVVDAFTSRPFSGNPAAVALVEAFPPDERMQLVAREMNLSETAFAVRRADGEHDLRWFTPSTEVELCGHATLAAAHVLGGSARFHTRGGLLACRPGEGGRIEMDFPADPPVREDPPPVVTLAGARFVGRGRFALLELERASVVRSLSLEEGTGAVPGWGTVIVTAAGDREGIDCVSRVFAPGLGVPEDPVTGSAHCMLAPFWAARTGRLELVAEQASPRGGILHLAHRGERVVLGGDAVTVAEVQLAC